MNKTFDKAGCLNSSAARGLLEESLAITISDR